jgi:hypothetical protein
VRKIEKSSLEVFLGESKFPRFCNRLYKSDKKNFLCGKFLEKGKKKNIVIFW